MSRPSAAPGTDLVSVVVGLRDANCFLREAIDSVFDQTHECWELLLIGDGSTGANTAIAETFAERYPDRVRYVHHHGDGGESAGALRSLGLERARGRFVAFLDADGVWLPHKLERQLQVMRAHPEVGVVYGTAQLWYSWSGDAHDAARDLAPDLGIDLGVPIDGQGLLVYLLRQTILPPRVGSLLVRRELVLPLVVGAAPIALTAHSPAVVRLVGEKMNAHLAHISQPGYLFRERDFYSGNFAIDRALFFEAGGFDEDFTLYGNEDCELARRLLMLGVPIIYRADALGHQRYTKSFAQLACNTYEKGRTRVLLSRKHPTIASALGVTADPRLSWKGRLLLGLLRRMRGPAPAPPFVGLVAQLDRRWPGRLARRYRAILDVYFWLGVTDERRSPRPAAA